MTIEVIRETPIPPAKEYVIRMSVDERNTVMAELARVYLGSYSSKLFALYQLLSA